MSVVPPHQYIGDIDIADTDEPRLLLHDDVIKWKHFPRYWPSVREIHRSPVNSPHKGQWRGALMFSLICAWINDWVNNREASAFRRHRAYYDVIVMDIYQQIHQTHFVGCRNRIGPSLIKHGLTLIAAWISNDMSNKVWKCRIKLRIQRCNRWSWEWMSNFIPPVNDCNYYSMQESKLIHVSKMALVGKNT